MNVRELAQWLSAFEDQDAEIEVVQHSRGTGYYDQGGTASVVAFDPGRHVTYTDLRGNPYARGEEVRTLLLGEVDA
jgi:hypothetical protein